MKQNQFYRPRKATKTNLDQPLGQDILSKTSSTTAERQIKQNLVNHFGKTNETKQGLPRQKGILTKRAQQLRHDKLSKPSSTTAERQQIQVNLSDKAYEIKPVLPMQQGKLNNTSSTTKKAKRNKTTSNTAGLTGKHNHFFKYCKGK